MNQRIKIIFIFTFLYNNVKVTMGGNMENKQVIMPYKSRAFYSANDESYQNYFQNNKLQNYQYYYSENFLSEATMLENHKRIIIIAEQGMGKSKFASNVGLSSNNKVIPLQIATDDDIKRVELLDAGYIVFDALDEADDNIKKIVLNFCNKNEKQKIILTTRPMALVEQFENFKPFRLLPLQFNDVKEIVEANTIDAEKFFTSTDKNNLHISCGNPMLLEIIINMFIKDTLEDKSIYDIWNKFITDALCETNNLKNYQHLTANSLYECSQWLATSMYLSGKNSFYIGEDKYCPPNSLTWNDVVKKFSKEEILSTLSRSIYKQVKLDICSFTHSSYYDFLLGEGIKSNINEKHLKKLLIDEKFGLPYIGMERIVVRLASSNDELLDILEKEQPELIIYNHELIEKVGKLELFKMIYDKLDYINYSFIHGNFQLRNLNSKEVIEEIYSILKSKKYDAKFFTFINMILNYYDSEVNLANILIDILSSSDIDEVISESIAYTLLNFTNDEIVTRLKDLAMNGDIFKNDNKDIIRGCILYACGNILTTEETLNLTTPIKNAYHFGRYQLYLIELQGRLKSFINDNNVNIVMTWTEKYLLEDVLKSDFDTLAKSIYTYVWKNNFSDKVIKFFFEKFNSYDFLTYFNTENDRLYNNTGEVISQDELLNDTDKIMRLILYGFKTDVNYKLDRCLHNISPNLRIKVVDLIIGGDIKYPSDSTKAFLYFPTEETYEKNKEKFGKLHGIDNNFPTIEDYNGYFKKVKIDSNKSQKNPYQVKERKRIAKRSRLFDSKLKTDTASETLFEELMIRTPAPYGSHSWHTNDWYTKLALKNQTVIIDSAILFLNSLKKCDSSKKDSTLALCLIFSYGKKYLDRINKSFWIGNFQLVLSCLQNSAQYNKIYDFIIENFLSEFEDAVFKDITENTSVDNSHLYNWHLWKSFAFDELIKKIIGYITTSNDIEKNIRILDKLITIEKNNHVAKYLKGIIPHTYSVQTFTDGDIKYLKLALRYILGDFIRLLIDIESQNKKLFKELSSEISYSRAEMQSTYIGNNSNDISNLFFILHKHFPKNKDENSGNGVYTPDNIVELKNFLINELKYRGIQDSASALQKIINECKEYKYLKSYLVETKKKEAAIFKKVFTSVAIAEIYCKSDKAIIKSSQDLLDYVIELLKEYQKELHGRYSHVNSLWNFTKDINTPKDENHLSDDIAYFINLVAKNSILSNREVQLKRKKPSGSDGGNGCNADILIETVDDCGKKYSLCIEVKKSDNNDIQNNFKIQLIDRYMSNVRADVGIFLVVYFGKKYLPNFKPEAKYQIDKIDSETKLKKYLNIQEEEYSKNNNVKAFILNCECK